MIDIEVKPQSQVASPILVTKLELGNQNAHPQVRFYRSIEFFVAFWRTNSYIVEL